MSQLNAHTEEYATALKNRMSGWESLSPAAQEVQYKVWMEEASANQVGCETHFFRSGTRLCKDPNLVPPGKKLEFDNLRRRMVSIETTPEQFDELVSTLRLSFKALKGWSNWWLRDVIARLIFPARRTMDPKVASEVPHSSNPVETQHALLHHASGKDHDMHIGIEKSFLHVEELRSQYDAIQGRTSLSLDVL